MSLSVAAAGALLPLAVAIPLCGAVLAPLLARLPRHASLVGCLLGMGGALAVLIMVAPRVFGGTVLVHYLGGWRPVGGPALGIAFAADPFGLLCALAVAGIGLLLLTYTLSELGGLGARELGGLACLFQLLLAALIGAALTGDLFNLFVWFQVAALSSYGLTGFFLERPIALEAAFKILVLTTIAGFFVFLGAGLLYARTGALNLGQLHRAGRAARAARRGGARAADRRLRHEGRPRALPRLARRRPHRRARARLRALLRADGQPRPDRIARLRCRSSRPVLPVLGAADGRSASPRPWSAPRSRSPRTSSSGCWPTTRSPRWA